MPSQPISARPRTRSPDCRTTVTPSASCSKVSTVCCVSSVTCVIVQAGVEDRGVDVGAMGHRVGMLETVEEALVFERDARDQVARQRAAHLHGRRAMGVGEHRVEQADLVERAEDIRAELDAGADFLELGRLLEHPHRKALARQRIGRRQAADAAAGDQERFLVLRCHVNSRTSNFGFVLVPLAEFQIRPTIRNQQLQRAAAETAATVRSADPMASGSQGRVEGMVQLGGFEPPTSGSTDRRSNQLSYSCTRCALVARPGLGGCDRDHNPYEFGRRS